METINNIRSTVTKAIEPVVQQVIDKVCSIYSNVYNCLPEALSEQEKLDKLKELLDAQFASYSEALHSAIDIDKLKQEVINNGRKL